jgi:hypothetical protein
VCFDAKSYLLGTHSVKVLAFTRRIDGTDTIFQVAEPTTNAMSEESNNAVAAHANHSTLHPPSRRVEGITKDIWLRPRNLRSRRNMALIKQR